MVNRDGFMEKSTVLNFSLNSCPPSVGVLVLSYNHCQYIRQCVEGILSQQAHFPINIYIHDDASSDGTGEILRQYADQHPNITLIRQTENQFSRGNFTALQKLLSINQSKYSILCEGDDFWTDPHKLQKQVDFLEKNPQYSICFHDVDIIDHESKYIDEAVANNYKAVGCCSLQDEFSLWDLLTLGNIMNTPSVLFRCHGNYRFLLGFTQDYFMHLHHAMSGNIKRIPGKMACYRVHSQGIISGLQQVPLAQRIRYGKIQIVGWKSFLRSHALSSPHKRQAAQKLLTEYDKLRSFLQKAGKIRHARNIAKIEILKFPKAVIQMRFLPAVINTLLKK